MNMIVLESCSHGHGITTRFMLILYAQNGWLSIDDFDSIVNVDNDTTGLWFFNSSKEAGATLPKKPASLAPWPEQI